MSATVTASPLADFVTALADARTADGAWAALHQLFAESVGTRLFTVTTVDVSRAEARRLYSNDPLHYPVSGAKPIAVDPWYELVVVRHQTLVANTLAEIAEHFFDHELIGSLGCGSAINLPVVFAGAVVATVNCLDVEHHFTPQRLADAKALALPALAAYLAAQRLAMQADLAP